MKKYQYKLVLILLLSIGYLQLGLSQTSLPFELKYEISRVYPSLTVTKDKVLEAQSLIDLNKYYKSSWVKKYLSVEISASHQENIKKAISKNDLLSQEQKDLLSRADVNTDIAVKVKYIPENTLKNNGEKEMNFTFKIDPEEEATYIGGQKQLNQYLQENAIEKIPATSFSQYQLTALKFTVDEEGQIVDAYVFESSKDKNVDTLLLETLCNMPNWSPATYANGYKVKQEFVLTAGDHTSCVINLLSIRQDSLN